MRASSLEIWSVKSARPRLSDPVHAQLLLGGERPGEVAAEAEHAAGRRRCWASGLVSDMATGEGLGPDAVVVVRAEDAVGPHV